MAEKRFKYKSGWTEGVSVPDGFININGYDPNNDERNYKLLEALNVDWKEIELPWAKSITKWNSWNIDPKNLSATGTDYTDAVDEALSADDVTQRLSNRVDWFNQNYDYLKDNGYIDENNKLEIPGWSKNGKIEKSEDIIDAINYLIWRVIAIDYFTNNWNNRNSVSVTYGFVKYDTSVLARVVNKSDENTHSLAEYKINYVYTPPFDFIFTPSPDRNDVELLVPTTNEQIVLMTTSPGDMSIDSVINSNNATITIGTNNSYNTQYSDDTDIYYFFILNAFIHGTAIEYRSPDTVNSKRGFVESYKEGSYSEFDPMSCTLSFDIKQKSGSTPRPNGTNVQYEEYSITGTSIIINKVINELQNLLFNDIQYNLTSSTVENYGTSYTSTTKGAVPYYKENIEGITNEYPISFTLKYGEEYGIYPYFFIKKNGSAVPGTTTYRESENSKLFSKFESDNYGSIVYNETSNKYIYIPPVEPALNSSDTDITICCVFYYADTDLSRQLTPVFLEFNIMLTATITNKIIFVEHGTSSVYQWSNNRKQFLNVIWNNSSIWTKETGCIVSAVENNVPYVVRTVTYDEYAKLDGNKINVTNSNGESREVSENAILDFDKFVTTYCNTTFDVEFLGIVDQSSVDDREISIDKTDIGNVSVSYVKNLFTVDTTPYQIRTTKILGNTVYYSADSATNYKLNETTVNAITSITDTTTKITATSVANNTYIEKLTDSQVIDAEYNNHLYNILKSTAVHTTDNGIVTDNDGGYYDADNDYYFLAFRITANEGANDGGIAYSACQGYYFLRVLRKNESPSFTFNGTTEDEIEYSTVNGDYTMRTQVRQTIYLNRLLNKTSQDKLLDFNGKKYWSFYGYDNSENTSASWDETKLAIKNTIEGENEQYMFIFNEGDTYKAKSYNKTASKTNIYNDISLPESNYIIDIENGTVDKTVEPFSNVNSGAILYVNKFMHAIPDTDGNPVRYEAIETDSMSMLLALALGNTEKYVRLASPVVFSFAIFKRQYDIQLLENAATKMQLASHPITNPQAVTIKPGGWNMNSNGQISVETNFKTAASLTRQYTEIFFLGSNEFGSGSDGDDIGEYTDVIAITVNDDSLPVISVSNDEGYSFSSNVMFYFDGNAKNLVNSNDTDTMMYLGTSHESNIEVHYHKKLHTDDTISQSFKKGIVLFAFNEPTQTPNKIEFIICTDEYGVYAEKTLKAYAIAKADDSTIELED